MLKTVLTGASILLTLTACATVAPTPTRDVARAASLATAPGRGCVSDTATRLPVRPEDCAGFGQTYTREDILRTGAHDTAEALQRLDPALRVYGH
jgi:hypothetical protein